MSAAALVEVLLMTFVLLAPALMVAMLASGLSRRPAPRLVEARADVGTDAEARRLRAVA